MLCCLRTGIQPFYGDYNEEMLESIEENHTAFTVGPCYLGRTSTRTRNMLIKMLESEPENRPSAKHALDLAIECRTAYLPSGF